MIAVVIVVIVIAAAYVVISDDDDEKDDGTVTTTYAIGDTISSSQISSLKESANSNSRTTLTISDENYSFVFDSKAISALSSGSLNASSVDVSTLAADVAAISGSGASAINITFGTNTNFGDGTVTVTMPYTLPNGKTADSLIAYAVSGSTLESHAVSYSNGKVSFTTNHFSIYVISSRMVANHNLATPSETLLRVYGNANCDAYINDDDITTLENILKGSADQTFYSDVNYDGYLGYDDVEYLKVLMSGGETRAFYQNYAYETKSVAVPIGKAIVIYYQVLEAVALLDGNIDRCLASDDYTCVNKASQFPGIEKVINLGNKSDITAEDLMSVKGTKTIITGSAKYHILPETEAQLTKDYDVVRLCNGASGFEIVWHVVTLGFLLGSDGGYDYLDFYNELKDLVEGRTASLTDDEKNNGLSVYFDSNTKYKIHDENSGSYEVLEVAGANNLAKGFYEKYNTLYYYPEDAEFIYAMEQSSGLDTFVFTKSSTIIGSNKADFQKNFYDYMYDSGLYKLKSFQDGKAIAICYNLTNSTPLMLGFLVESALMYPDLYKDVNISNYLQRFYDKFTLMDFDVNKDAYFYCTSQDLMDAGYDLTYPSK